VPRPPVLQRDADVGRSILPLVRPLQILVLALVQLPPFRDGDASPTAEQQPGRASHAPNEPEYAPPDRRSTD